MPIWTTAIALNATQNGSETGGEKTQAMGNASLRGIKQQGNLLLYRLKQDGHREFTLCPSNCCWKVLAAHFPKKIFIDVRKCEYFAELMDIIR